jgi:UDP-glucose 4-epimerase
VPVVLVTGVSRFLGTHLAARLAANPAVERVIGVDTAPPRNPGGDLHAPALGRTEFIRADIRNPLIARVISQAGVDIVVHTSPHARLYALRAPQLTPQDQHVTGTMQLLAACQTSPTITRVVLASTTAVYGSSSRNPAAFVESMPPTTTVARGYARESVEVETYTRGFARRRPDIDVSILRLANIVGPTIDSALTRYLAMPLVPTSLGYDPRLQLLHEDDAVGALEQAVLGARPGVVNIAGEGVVTLAQAVRWAGRARVPVPAPAIALVGSLVRNSGVVDVSAEEASFLNYGRVVDTTRMRTEFGYRARYTTAEALRSYLDARPALGRPVIGLLRRAQQALADRAALPAGAH